MVKSLVIIGAGNAGLALVNAFHNFKDLDVTIIERKDHFDMVMQQPRSLVNDAFARESLWNIRDAVNSNAKIVQARDVLAIENGEVKIGLHDGSTKTLSAQAVVIATGSSYKSQFLKNNDGLNKDQWVAKIAQWRSALVRSKHVMIIGGGLTGVEVAAEIATDFPSIKTTIVHKGDKLLNGSEKFHNRTMKALQSLPGEVAIILNDAVSAQETLGDGGPQTYTTDNGKQIVNVDIVLQCVGVQPNTAFIPSAQLDPRGYIEVDERLLATKLTTPQIPVFAIGDCSNKGGNRALIARDQGAALAKGLKSWARSGNVGVVWKKKDTKAPVFASLGRGQGIANFPFINNFLPRMLKAGGMFVEMSVGILQAKGMNARGKYKLSPAAKAPEKVSTRNLRAA
jgi:pyruvate/2-oxoglutarate dehydrogenase complex dihydrolipoamide dehydrogenase (E3) component